MKVDFDILSDKSKFLDLCDELNSQHTGPDYRVLWNKTKRLSIPFFFEPSFDFKMSPSFLSGAAKSKYKNITFEKFLNKSLKKFVEYQR